jgi:hypothetical protein
MMVTFIDLYHARIDRLSACAEAWLAMAGRFRALAQRLEDDLARPLRASGWQGPAADAALDRLDAFGRELRALATRSRTVSAIVGQATVEFDRLQRNLDGILDAVTTLGLRIDAGGRVCPGADTVNAATYNDLVTALLDRATRIDADVSAAIRDYSLDAVVQSARLPGIDGTAIPHPGDPRATAQWWAGLRDDERYLYQAAYPDRIGALDGLPASVRDEANRQALREWLDRPATPAHGRARRVLALLEAGDAGSAARRPYLMGIDLDGDGRAVIALGDPDAARHTAVLVPGAGADLDGIRGLLDRAGVIRDAADARHSGDGDVAVVAWLGYDPPDGDDIAAAPFGGRARDGAPALDAFVDGLRAAHRGPPGHVSVIGHSYGTAVIGEAASRGDGLAIDDIIAVGSPGLRVNHASELNVGADRVWVLAAANDHIAEPAQHGWYIGALSGWAERAAHGPAPHEPAFGAHRLDAEPNGHSGYWRSGSVSLANQARIVTADRPHLES